MFSKSKIAIDTIGNESFYVMEKSGTAIYKENHVDVDLAKSLILAYISKYQDLKSKIDIDPIYDNSYFDHEFETLNYALQKLHSILGNVESKEKELEASIFHQHFCKQDKKIRTAIEESNS